MIKTLLPLLVIIALSSCKNQIKLDSIGIQNATIKKNQHPLKGWLIADIETDTIPGISLNRAIENKLLKSKNEDSIIVAVIDTEVDINHEILRKNIWTNKKEIPENGKDDDFNGYVDDLHGWNFIGNKSGENIIYANNESLRIIRTYENDSNSFVNKKLYEKALVIYNESRKAAISDMKYVTFLTDTYPKSKKALLKFFPEEDYTTEQLDSLYKIYDKKDKELAKLIYYMSDYIKYDLSKKWIDDLKRSVQGDLNNSLNPKYNDRDILGDDPHDLNDINYGNPTVNGNLNKLYHGTEVAALIAGHGNDKMISVCESCLIMPICISSNGNENDKDIALGIKYAVDNGAKVINMSFGKELSLHNEWVLDAIKYAGDHNVLIVSSAGNGSLNLDNVKDYYPNDYSYTKKSEVSNNFILVGASTSNLNKNLVASFSNYGKCNVDIFAPGAKIESALPYNKYKKDSGTSLSSAIVSGVAALILSKHPHLAPSQIKKIILNSGVNYSIDVIIPGKSDDSIVPFNNLSKSGKIVNVYNALILADKLK
ncbi:S8 family serine peptidase [Galbibacter sp. BG1]|uniref:S8 family serine peptidase n=1 Tax=Galbibacter sp. BG1 TaxID=1170699 RepID=UPI0015C155F2|nr:S8 family serine peptidase [Galbibacter sp. BG1]QLE00951.1 S8 family serine peptidase [Galbibacter sp. BG1]